MLRREGELTYPADPRPITLETIFDVRPDVDIYPADPIPKTVLTRERELIYPTDPRPPVVDTNKGAIELR